MELGLSRRGKLFELTYEELCADKDGVLRRVCEYLGLDEGRFADEVWRTSVSNQNYKWKEQLDGKVVERVMSAVGPAMARRGYA